MRRALLALGGVAIAGFLFGIAFGWVWYWLDVHDEAATR